MQLSPSYIYLLSLYIILSSRVILYKLLVSQLLKKCSTFHGPADILPCLEESALLAGAYIPVHLTIVCYQFIILSTYLCLFLSSNLFHLSISSNIYIYIYIYIFNLSNVSNVLHLAQPRPFFIVSISGENNKLWSSSSCTFLWHPLTPFF
jgi:hypothetical protein